METRVTIGFTGGGAVRCLALYSLNSDQKGIALPTELRTHCTLNYHSLKRMNAEDAEVAKGETHNCELLFSGLDPHAYTGWPLVMHPTEC